MGLKMQNAKIMLSMKGIPAWMLRYPIYHPFLQHQLEQELCFGYLII